MDIAIIGAGAVGRTLGECWVSKGHRVAFGVRNRQSEAVRALKAPDRFSIKAPEEACTDAEAVLLAVPWSGALDVVRRLGSLNGKVLIDPINSFTPDLALSIGFSTSVAEEIAKAAPGAWVVKAFNTLGISNLANLDFKGRVASGFICGDDAPAKAIVATLTQEAGFEVVDCGPLKNARALEPLAMLWGQLAFMQGLGPEIAFKLLRR
jgi:8-hydroxy-5-deazaflavin:NADPH oxidoreductase